MREPIDSMHDRILVVLEKAGRNKRQIGRTLDKLEKEIRQQTGEKNTEWTEEYYVYLLELYRQGIDKAIQSAVSREEYEWAEILTCRKANVDSTLDVLEPVK
jgi:hypothetical protein